MKIMLHIVGWLGNGSNNNNGDRTINHHDTLPRSVTTRQHKDKLLQEEPIKSVSTNTAASICETPLLKVHTHHVLFIRQSDKSINISLFHRSPSGPVYISLRLFDLNMKLHCKTPGKTKTTYTVE